MALAGARARHAHGRERLAKGEAGQADDEGSGASWHIGASKSRRSRRVTSSDAVDRCHPFFSVTTFNFWPLGEVLVRGAALLAALLLLLLLLPVDLLK